MKKKPSVIILAAGESSRMGTPKFLLKYDEDITFLEKIINEYEAFNSEQIIVVLNKHGLELLEKSRISFSNKVKFVTNSHPEWERFYSLKLGLRALDNKNGAFIHNADNPFANLKILSLLVESVMSSDYVIPKHKDRGGHPILISEKVIRNIIAEEKNNLNLKDYLLNYNKAFVVVNDENILLNVNSKEDYDKFKKKV